MADHLPGGSDGESRWANVADPIVLIGPAVEEHQVSPSGPKRINYASDAASLVAAG